MYGQTLNHVHQDFTIFFTQRRSPWIILVGGIPTPLKNMTSSVGMMKFATEWKNKIHFPNHQPVKWNITFIVDLPIKHGDFPSYVSLPQRVYWVGKTGSQGLSKWINPAIYDILMPASWPKLLNQNRWIWYSGFLTFIIEQISISGSIVNQSFTVLLITLFLG